MPSRGARPPWWCQQPCRRAGRSSHLRVRDARVLWMRLENAKLLLLRWLVRGGATPLDPERQSREARSVPGGTRVQQEAAATFTLSFFALTTRKPTGCDGPDPCETPGVSVSSAGGVPAQVGLRWRGARWRVRSKVSSAPWQRDPLPHSGTRQWLSLVLPSRVHAAGLGGPPCVGQLPGAAAAVPPKHM